MGAGSYGGFGNTYGTAVPGDAVYRSNPELYFEYIGKRTDKDKNGVYDIVAYGEKKIIRVEHNGKIISIDSRVAAKLIAHKKDYKNGQALRLLSCNTGSSPQGFAQNLANKLNVVVEAPTKLVWAFPNGKYIVASRMKNNPNKPNLKDLGRFKKFYPGGKKK